MAARLGGLAVGVALDAVLADPARLHPVAGFGQAATRLETRLYRDSRRAGALHTALLVAAVALPTAAAESLLARTRPGTRIGARAVAVTAGLSWVVLGGASLRRAGRGIGARLSDGDLAGARARLPTLCGRDPSLLDDAGVARAAIESLAENTCDAIVAPLWWGAAAGLPGLAGYRAVNTLDAMVGHHSERYERFGWAAARLDDAANLLPARLCALAACAAAPLVGGNPVDAYWVMRRDGRSHPSPNAGMVEAAFAGALGLRLGGELRYPYRVEHRPELGFGRPPTAADVDRAARLSAAAGLASLTVTAIGTAAAAAALRRTVGVLRGAPPT